MQEHGVTKKIWAPGVVKRVADGLTHKADGKHNQAKGLAIKSILPAGALLWAWDADPTYDEAAGDKWLVLLPDKWNRQVQYAWRYDPCELEPAGRPKPPPRAPRVRGKPAPRRTCFGFGNGFAPERQDSEGIQLENLRGSRLSVSTLFPKVDEI